MDKSWQDGVIEERRKLFDKITNLKDFLKNSSYKDTGELQRDLLQIQVVAMETYYRILVARIANFE
jgi:hypothetical protein